MRLDANRAYSEVDACRFAGALDPSGIELFEQPCGSDEWEANAKVASVSSVPIMLDELICSLADVERAGSIKNVGFCKLKLKRFGGLDLVREALDRRRGSLDRIVETTGTLFNDMQASLETVPGT